MTKLEELKAAYEMLGVKEACRTRVIESDPYRSHVVTAGCCVLAECNGVTKEAMGNFIALAHNMMPDLLEAIDRYEALTSVLYSHGTDHPVTHKAEDMLRATLEKLK